MSEKFAEDSSPQDARLSTGSTGSAAPLTVANRLLPCLVVAVLISASAGADAGITITLAALALPVCLFAAALVGRQQRRTATSLSRLQRAAAGEVFPVPAGATDPLIAATDTVLAQLARAVQLLRASRDTMTD